ncbi:iron-containing alcohol dehydrogenase [Candidatus Bathyarchaeota archaeon]|nr:iron-containing alcohol dehydrogenase [Candidatus Bathyarchaeota archaeon]
MLGIVLGHGVAYAFSAQYKVPHGVAVGIALPYIVRYTMSLIQDKLSIIGRAVQINTEGKASREVATSIKVAPSL